MYKQRVLIAVGGTGGHVFPAVSLGRELAERGVEVIFVGGGLSNNKFFDKEQFKFREIKCGFLSTANPLQLLRGMLNVGQGMLEARKVLKEFQPDVVVGFGSFYTFPILSTAKLLSIPIILHEQNAIPGRVNRLMSPYVACTAISMPDASKYLSGHVVQVGMPLKLKTRFTKVEARQHYKLDPTAKTILIFGGSQGANAINQTMLKSLPDLKNCQVIHFTGNNEDTQRAVEMYRGNKISSCVKDFETRMDCAWSAADLAITRSGASTIAEAIEYDVPLIMVPFAKAMDNHQEKNADFMIQTVGGGEKILEPHLRPDLLSKTIVELPHAQMKRSIMEYKGNTKSQTLYSLVDELLCRVSFQER
jgi:UDP-N-acetylglucosamine--N-acetylmuramyl-(pentapeptide) pyrophosphoryl-undecaprenol N-acetylglucosamine transferase